MAHRPARIVWDLDGTVVGLVRTPAGTRISLRPGIVRVLEKLRRDGHTLVLWTFGTRRWWWRVREAFPVLRDVFAEVWTRDELPGKLTEGRGFPEPVKDIRMVRGDVLVDNEPAHHEWARRHGLAHRYVLVRTFGAV